MVPAFATLTWSVAVQGIVPDKTGGQWGLLPWEEVGALTHTSGALCPQVWRSDVQFAWKHLLCPDGEFLDERRRSLGTVFSGLASPCFFQSPIGTWGS